jgi:hypothetical protein
VDDRGEIAVSWSYFCSSDLVQRWAATIPADGGAPVTEQLTACEFGACDLALHILRKKIGTKRFFGLLRSWADHNKGKNVTTRQFQDFAEKYTGKQLDGFFHTWVYTAGKPKL